MCDTTNTMLWYLTNSWSNALSPWCFHPQLSSCFAGDGCWFLPLFHSCRRCDPDLESSGSDQFPEHCYGPQTSPSSHQAAHKDHNNDTISRITTILKKFKIRSPFSSSSLKNEKLSQTCMFFLSQKNLLKNLYEGLFNFSKLHYFWLSRYLFGVCMCVLVYATLWGPNVPTVKPESFWQCRLNIIKKN